MDQINQIFNSLCDFNTVLQRVSAFKHFTSAHPELDRETRPNCTAHTCQYFPRESKPIFKTSTILVGTMIERRAQKLIDQPSMTAVYHDHLEACTFAESSCFAICFHDVLNLFLYQCFDRNPIWTDPVAGAILRKISFGILIDQIGSGILSGVAQLNAGNCTVSCNGIRYKGPTCQTARRFQVKVEHMAGIRCGMNDQLTRRNRCCSAFCTQLIETRCARPHTAVCRNIRTSHRSTEHTISEINTSNSDRLTQMWIFLCHLKHIPFLIQIDLP